MITNTHTHLYSTPQTLGLIRIQRHGNSDIMTMIALSDSESEWQTVRTYKHIHTHTHKPLTCIAPIAPFKSPHDGWTKKRLGEFWDLVSCCVVLPFRPGLLPILSNSHPSLLPPLQSLVLSLYPTTRHSLNTHTPTLTDNDKSQTHTHHKHAQKWKSRCGVMQWLDDGITQIYSFSVYPPNCYFEKKVKKYECP